MFMLTEFVRLKWEVIEAVLWLLGRGDNRKNAGSKGITWVHKPTLLLVYEPNETPIEEDTKLTR